MEPEQIPENSNTELEKDSDAESVSDILNQPKVPLHIDPEFVDPNQGKYKYGIIYLSYIPEGLNVKILKEIMSEFGELGRVYLEPEKNNKKRRTYIEGWIEFKKKRAAKLAAKSLNGTPLTYGRKHCKMNGQIWSIKYLHRFKWAHLTEQLAHDKATREQKRRFEMTQTKKQVDFYQKMMERSKRLRKVPEGAPAEPKSNRLKAKQNKPRSQGEEQRVTVDEDLLGCIFKKVA